MASAKELLVYLFGAMMQASEVVGAAVHRLQIPQLVTSRGRPIQRRLAVDGFQGVSR